MAGAAIDRATVLPVLLHPAAAASAAMLVPRRTHGRARTKGVRPEWMVGWMDGRVSNLAHKKGRGSAEEIRAERISRRLSLHSSPLCLIPNLIRPPLASLLSLSSHALTPGK